MGMITEQEAGLYIILIGVLCVIAGIFILIYDNLRVNKYTEQVQGTVIRHVWVRVDSMQYPCAVVSYMVNGKEYTCIQRYRSFIYTVKRYADIDWEIDNKYRLHHYSADQCKVHVDPTIDWFPIGSQLTVHYKPGKPKKAYCGSLISLKLMFIIFCSVGIGIVLFGLLLRYVIK